MSVETEALQSQKDVRIESAVLFPFQLIPTTF